MELPTRDVRFLNERGLVWELLPDPNGAAYVLVRNFDVSGGGFAPTLTDLMIRIPQQYPITPLDMWYCDPPLRIQATGQFAQASDVMEPHLGRTWQRFSRHFNNGWQPGIDCLRSFFTLVQRELQGIGRH